MTIVAVNGGGNTLGGPRYAQSGQSAPPLAVEIVG